MLEIPESLKYAGNNTCCYAIDGKLYSYYYANEELGFLNVIEVYLDDKELAENESKKKINNKECENVISYDHSRFMPN